MIFANGTSIRDWHWAAVKAIELTEEEQKKYPIPGKKGEYMKYRMDMKNLKEFHERDYIDALILYWDPPRVSWIFKVFFVYLK